MPIYIIVGDTYGITGVYWTTEDEATQYKHELEKEDPSEHWRLIALFPPMKNSPSRLDK